MNQNDADMVQETKDLRAVVEEQEKEAAAQEEVEAKKAEEAAADKDEAERLVSETQAIYDSLSAEAAAAVEAERQARATENAQAFELTAAMAPMAAMAMVAHLLVLPTSPLADRAHRPRIRRERCSLAHGPRWAMPPMYMVQRVPSRSIALGSSAGA